MEADATKPAGDIGSAMKADELAALKREKGELEEKLEAADAKECPSCKAVFQRGEGRVVAKEKPESKPKSESKPESKPEAKPEAEPEVKPKKEESIFDAFIGPDEE